MTVLPVVLEEVQRAAVAPVTRLTRRIAIYESDTTTLWKRDVPFVEGTITVSYDSQERRSADITLLNENGALTPNRNDGFWYDKVIKIYMGFTVEPSIWLTDGRWEAIVGTFLIDQISTSDRSDTISVTLRDFSKKMSYDLTNSLIWPEHTPIENILDTLASGAGIPSDNIDLPLTGVSTDIETFLEKDSNRWTSAVEIAQAHNYNLYFTAAGELTMSKFVDPATEPPELEFRTGSNSNITKAKREVADSRIFNHIGVHGVALDGSPIFAEAWNRRDDSPTNIVRLGVRTKTFDSKWVTTLEQAEELAVSMLAHNSLEQHNVKLGSVIMPWLEVGPVVEFVDPYSFNTDRYLLSEFNLNLDLTESEATILRIIDVIDRFVPFPEVDTYPELSLYPNVEL